MTTPHDEQAETELETILINFVAKELNIRPEHYAGGDTLANTKAEVTAWSRQQTARVLDELLKQKQGFYASHDLNHWREIVPVAAIEALRVGLEERK